MTNELIVLDTPAQIAGYRLLTMHKALEVEVRFPGMRMTSKVNVFALVKREFGFKGSKASVLKQLEDYMDAQGFQYRRFTSRN